ncbi:uncharacterized protein si:zfos-741a10.3 [Morone saxatilis]|uniref:uncharacterized protein si:zfos-741a10.3 n=1 Tax=Morone saxatilis TaxID=34816 RepID=UPI0015E1EA94|nr:uncharacterized protein si:zfos-741a10.3 [Morone saxatilis]
MEQFIILLVILAGVTSNAAETTCNAMHNTSQCTVTLGGSVYIQIVTNASGYKVHCKKQLPTANVTVLYMNKDKVKIQGPLTDRAEFFINNGTLKITNVERNDSGLYILEVFNSDGVRVKNSHMILDFQESDFPLFMYICIGVGALIIVVIVVSVCCFVCKKVRRDKKPPTVIFI